jgi:predicted AAA+ superfamily ATPase
MVSRDKEPRLYHRIYAPPRQSFFLFGPRGVGKSTWAKQRFAQAHRIDLLDEALYQSRQTEVDFVLNRGNDFMAIEVKSGTKVSNQALSGLRAVKDLPRMIRRILLYGGKREMKSADGVEIWPMDLFLDALASDRLWP